MSRGPQGSHTWMSYLLMHLQLGRSKTKLFISLKSIPPSDHTGQPPWDFLDLTFLLQAWDLHLSLGSSHLSFGCPCYGCLVDLPSRTVILWLTANDALISPKCPSDPYVPTLGRALALNAQQCLISPLQQLKPIPFSHSLPIHSLIPFSSLFTYLLNKHFTTAASKMADMYCLLRTRKWTLPLHFKFCRCWHSPAFLWEVSPVQVMWNSQSLPGY